MFFLFIKIAILVALAVGVYNFFRPLPENVSFSGEVYRLGEDDVEFLYDLTYLKGEERVVEQEIFEEVFGLIENAEEFVLLDLFLFNNDFGDQDHFLNLTSRLTESLIRKKEENPEIRITLLTDPINNFYGGYTAEHFLKLHNAGVNVVVTDLTKLRDSNPLYSGFWRSYLQWFGTSGKGWIAHPLGNEDHKITLRSVLSVFNAKANHRKVIVADNGGEMVSVITSGNPHDASSLHSNIAFKIRGPIWKDILATETAVAEFSGGEIEAFSREDPQGSENMGDIQVQLVTEGKIRESLIRDIDSTEEGDEIDMAMFYLSDRKIIRSLLNASERGVLIRMILDPNKDAFAREKNGIPNRQVAYELHKKTKGGIQVRWYDTRGEQFHAKLTVIRKGGETIAHGGSANLTKRNIGDFNLETNVRVVAQNETEISRELREYFERIWNNEAGEYTLDFEGTYKEPSQVKYWVYRFQEWSGMSTF